MFYTGDMQLNLSSSIKSCSIYTQEETERHEKSSMLKALGLSLRTHKPVSVGGVVVLGQTPVGCLVDAGLNVASLSILDFLSIDRCV